MLKEPSVFEPFDPATFGGQRRLLFGTQTGRDSARQLVELVDKNPSTERVETLRQKLEKKGPVNKQEAKELANQLK
jgi:isopropylmalate/homocitrate/citramalate synthase